METRHASNPIELYQSLAMTNEQFVLVDLQVLIECVGLEGALTLYPVKTHGVINRDHAMRLIQQQKMAALLSPAQIQSILPPNPIELQNAASDTQKGNSDN